MSAARDVSTHGHDTGHTHIYIAHICIHIYIYNTYIYIYIYIHNIYQNAHKRQRYTHGWPTNLRFYSSSQLFGWLNCYKGTLLRSTVYARYILVHFVYGLWLSRLIRFAMFLLHGPTRGARTDDKGPNGFVRSRISRRKNLKRNSMDAAVKMEMRRGLLISQGIIKSCSQHRVVAKRFPRRSKAIINKSKTDKNNLIFFSFDLPFFPEYSWGGNPIGLF